VDAVLEPIAAAMAKDAWIVDHTTTAVRPTAERVARWDARGRKFVHAPVVMGPSNAAQGTGLMLVSGEQSRHEALLPVLQQMTGSVLYLGAAPERAAAFKLFGNLTLIGIMGVLGDVNRLAHAVGIPTGEAFSLFKHFNPGQFLPARAARIEAGDFTSPSFEVSMARKDVRLMIEEAARGGVDLFVMPGVAAMFDAAIARGEGALDAAAAARAPQ
jgi:3-hydroxyisobutyrate dehydrogenase